VSVGDLPSIDFATFILSLSHSALLYMGEAKLDNEHVEVSFPLAKQNIDLLGILEQKTKGNLTGDEETLLAQVLTDLRNKYVELADARK
jgi:hypothetical protein